MMSTRKKPGRPRKKVDISPISIQGIVTEPVNPTDCVDLIYNQPQLLKCIVSIFKEYDSDEIIIEFYPDRVIFTGKDHSLRVSIHIVINAADMNLYYFSPPPSGPFGSLHAGGASSSVSALGALIQDTSSVAGDDDGDGDGDADGGDADDVDGDGAADVAGTADSEEIVLANKEVEPPAVAATAASSAGIAGSASPYRVVVKRDNLEIVSAIIEKTHYKLMISLRRDDLSSLYITLSNCEYDSEDGFEVSIVPRSTDDMPVITIPDLTQYPLEFTLDSHHLRRKIGELKKVSPDMVIKKCGPISEKAPAASAAQAGAGSGGIQPTDLEITFGTNSRVVYTGTYKTASKIRLRSNIADGEMFVATMSIGRIRPLMAVNLPGGITFYANKIDPLVIQVGLDQRADAHFAIIARLLINTAH